MDLFGLAALALEASRAVVRELVGFTRLLGQLLGGVLQASEAGFKPCFLAEHGHFQACFGTTAVGVHLRDQRVGGGLLGHAQQAFDAAGLPGDAGQAQRDGEQGGEDEAPVAAHPMADQETDLADQDEGHPRLDDG